MERFTLENSADFTIFRPKRRNRKRTGYFALALLVTATMASGANPPQVPSTQGPSPQGPSQPQVQAASPMDYPIRLMAEAQQAFQGVRDYSCLFVKRERIQGQLGAENLIDMHVRNQPFSVYLRWMGPPTLQGQEACYVAGANNGQLRVHSTGLAGAVGFVSVSPTDSRVMQNNRHPITDAGIGHLIEIYGQRWEMERRLGLTTVRAGEFQYNQKRCVRVELTRPDNRGGQFYAYRTLMYFDKATHLPIRVESYDWPKPGGPPGGELFESYSYANLKLNPGLPDAVFKH
jgi:uncharacterized protein DUF1571